MKRRPLLIFLMAFWLIGCDQQVQSQSTFRPEANAAPGVQDSIGFGRTTAITRAVQIATPAVVSVNVTQTQRIQVNPYQDPFYDF